MFEAHPGISVFLFHFYVKNIIAKEVPVINPPELLVKRKIKRFSAFFKLFIFLDIVSLKNGDILQSQHHQRNTTHAEQHIDNSAVEFYMVDNCQGNHKELQ